MSEYVSPMGLKKIAVSMDFSETAIMDVAQDMGVHPSELLVFANRMNAPYAKDIANKLGCSIVLVPDEIIKRDHWAAHHNQRHEFGMWSTGA